tara:strand:- start:252 stop:362 length:111 start_codon:yes stop_codon:yes gene_type:complete
MLGIIFNIFQGIVTFVVAVICLIAIYVLIFDWDKYR